MVYIPIHVVQYLGGVETEKENKCVDDVCRNKNNFMAVVVKQFTVTLK